MNRKKKNLRTRRRAFSLLEITLVLVIIGLLIAGAAVSLRGVAKRAKIRTTETRLTTISAALSEYNLNVNEYPVSLEELITADYLEDKPLEDSWGEKLIYVVPSFREGKEFDLISKGPDKQYNTNDDINVWDIGKKD